jgi:hypothetical protein
MACKVEITCQNCRHVRHFIVGDSEPEVELDELPTQCWNCGVSFVEGPFKLPGLDPNDPVLPTRMTNTIWRPQPDKEQSP